MSEAHGYHYPRIFYRCAHRTTKGVAQDPAKGEAETRTTRAIPRAALIVCELF